MADLLVGLRCTSASRRSSSLAQQTSSAQEISRQGFIIRMQVLQWITETGDVGFGFCLRQQLAYFFLFTPKLLVLAAQRTFQNDCYNYKPVTSSLKNPKNLKIL